MIPEDLLKETFQDLVEKYDIKLDLKSKMRFNIYSIEDLPHEIKQDIQSRCKTICDCIERKRFELDHPLIYRKNDSNFIKGGIWSVRIF